MEYIIALVIVAAPIAVILLLDRLPHRQDKKLFRLINEQPSAKDLLIRAKMMLRTQQKYGGLMARSPDREDR